MIQEEPPKNHPFPIPSYPRSKITHLHFKLILGLKSNYMFWYKWLPAKLQ